MIRIEIITQEELDRMLRKMGWTPGFVRELVMIIKQVEDKI